MGIRDEALRAVCAPLQDGARSLAWRKYATPDGTLVKDSLLPYSEVHGG